MKINVGCGQDVRVGYLNIDKYPVSKDVTFGDATNLDKLSILDSSVDEILAIHLIQYLPLSILDSMFEGWNKKLAKDGTIYIESTDACLMGTMMAFVQQPMEVYNNILYNMQGEPIKSIHNLCDLESFIKTKGFETVVKGYKGTEFYLQMRKV